MLSQSARRDAFKKVDHAPNRRSARLSGETRTYVQADARIVPLRDQIILEPLDVIYSRHIIVQKNPTKALRGIVKAIGPGHYPKRYNHPEKQKRSLTWDSYVFLPTEVKVGDIVELGGAEIDGYSFDTFFWGDQLHVICSERDVAVVLDA